MSAIWSGDVDRPVTFAETPAQRRLARRALEWEEWLIALLCRVQGVRYVPPVLWDDGPLDPRD
jgi:hypothetical protein